MITAMQALTNLEAVLNDAFLDEISTEIISDWIKIITTALDERKVLREALEPLNWDDSEIAAYAWCPDDKFIGEVSAGDIRKANAIIAKLST